MTLAAGTTLGAYEIESFIGAGGMGEVYRARDPRLGRDVAIKILPGAAARDVERRARFEREARAVAALNHPGIVTVHAVEEADGVPFFTMEFVEGRTLAQIIAEHGLPLDELLRIAIPLTDAVGAAHQRGILHRDLKPANVMVTPEGRVKVLDFGLAKLKEGLAEAATGTAATVESTGDGRILGTVAYMSPEQAEGKALDERSDVFSLGIILYEMATGQRPFKGDTNVSVISAILKDTPGSATDLRPDLPHDVVRILKRALNKDPERRYQTAKDLRNDLETLKEDLDSGEIARAATPSVRSAPSRRLSWAAAAVVALALVVTGAWWGTRLLAPVREAPPKAGPFENFTMTPLTAGEGVGSVVAVSPDGQYVAYAFVEQGRQGLRVRQAETSATVQVVPPGDVQYNSLTFTPDGNKLYYAVYPRERTQASLYEVPVLGGVPPRRLIDDVDGGVTFSPDATRVAFTRGLPPNGSAIVVANVDGTDERVLVTRQMPDDFALDGGSWSPDGRLIAAAAYDGAPTRCAIVTVNATTGVVETLGTKRWDFVGSLTWLRDGSGLLVEAVDAREADTEQIWEVGFPDGAVRRVTRDIARYTSISLAADGRTLVTHRSEPRGTIWVAPSANPESLAQIAAVGDGVRSEGSVRWAPDGRILYTASVRNNVDVFSVRPDGTDLRRLTTSPALDALATASPDNRYIIFLSDRDGGMRVWRMDSDGGRQIPLTSGPFDGFPVVAHDSASVYFVRMDEPSMPMYAVGIDGGEPTLLSGTPSATTASAWAGVPRPFFPNSLSPDGKLIAGFYPDLQHNRFRVAIVPVGGKAVVMEFPVPLYVQRYRDWLPAWTADGRAVTLLEKTSGATALWKHPMDGGPATRLASYTGGDEIVGHAWSVDGRWLAVVRRADDSHVVIMRDTSGSR
jgi:Tol biopolymer transport system component